MDVDLWIDMYLRTLHIDPFQQSPDQGSPEEEELTLAL